MTKQRTLAALEIGFGVVGELIRRLLGWAALLQARPRAYCLKCGGRGNLAGRMRRRAG